MGGFVLWAVFLLETNCPPFFMTPLFTCLYKIPAFLPVFHTFLLNKHSSYFRSLNKIVS